MADNWDVIAINRNKGIALLDNDEIIPLMETDHGTHIAIVCGPDSRGNWYALEDVREFSGRPS